MQYDRSHKKPIEINLPKMNKIITKFVILLSKSLILSFFVFVQHFVAGQRSNTRYVQEDDTVEYNGPHPVRVTATGN